MKFIAASFQTVEYTAKNPELPAIKIDEWEVNLISTWLEEELIIKGVATYPDFSIKGDESKFHPSYTLVKFVNI